MTPNAAITEADLHAYVDGQLSPERAREIEAYLASRPEEARRIESYRAQTRDLRALFDPILDEVPPQKLLRSAVERPFGRGQQLVAGLAIAVVAGALGWRLHGEMPARPSPGELARRPADALTLASADRFALRAAVAHAVYGPDQRRAVEVDAAHEDQLVAWLSKRMGVPIRVPHLRAVGYVLEGGRLLPGGQGPVAQFMYRDESGAKLTLYVSNEVSDLASASGETAFRFASQGAVNVFYWVDGPFGYALSAQADQNVLARVSAEVYRQLAAAH